MDGLGYHCGHGGLNSNGGGGKLEFLRPYYHPDKAHPVSNANRHRNATAFPYSSTYAYNHAYAGAHIKPGAHANAGAYRYGYAHSYNDTGTYAHTVPDPNSQAQSDTYGYPDGNTYPFSHPDAGADRAAGLQPSHQRKRDSTGPAFGASSRRECHS